MHTDLNKIKLMLAHIVVVLILTSVWAQQLLLGQSFMYWYSNFGPIVLPSITSRDQISQGSSSAALEINGDVEISAGRSTAAQLSYGTDTLVTEYKLTFDGDGTPKTGKSGGIGTEDYEPYDTFLETAAHVTYFPDDNDVQVTLHVQASNYANDLANAGTYTATQTLTVHWVGP